MRREPGEAADRLIVALDNPDLRAAEALMDRLSGRVRLYKIGSALFTRSGPAGVEAVHRRGGKVFLDLKFHDIPQTVALAARQAGEMGVFMFNVHASGGTALLRAAREAVSGLSPAPLLVAVTVLTSLDADDLKAIGFLPDPDGLALRLAKMAQEAGLDGVVASPREVKALREACGGDFLIVTPGVRPAGSEEARRTDQKRFSAPGEALACGADYLVVGRPITGAPDPAAAAEAVLDEMSRALTGKERASGTPPSGGRRARIRIHGRVQGIGFRWSARREAAKRGISGWVRNRADGTVEALAEGDDLAGFLAWCEKGPHGARVDRTEVLWEEGGERLEGFHIRTD